MQMVNKNHFGDEYTMKVPSASQFSNDEEGDSYGRLLQVILCSVALIDNLREVNAQKAKIIADLKRRRNLMYYDKTKEIPRYPLFTVIEKKKPKKKRIRGPSQKKLNSVRDKNPPKKKSNVAQIKASSRKNSKIVQAKNPAKKKSNVILAEEQLMITSNIHTNDEDPPTATD